MFDHFFDGVSKLCTADDFAFVLRYDNLGDGRMDVGELSNAMQALGEAASKKQVAQLITTFDRDVSGFLEANEFVSWFSLRRYTQSPLVTASNVQVWRNDAVTL